jgi:hypothetical protein
LKTISAPFEKQIFLRSIFDCIAIRSASRKALTDHEWATFKVNSWMFTLVTIHTKPSDVSNELTNLETLVGIPQGDTIILGDLNADGDYYNNDIIQHFLDWT